jgi:ABC-type lipoprotein export system ATPase subunit
VTGVPPVRLEGVRFSYSRGGFSLAVDSLSIERGERVALVGPSGCGKTTLVSLVTGVLVPDAGAVHLGDALVSDLTDGARRALRLERVGMVFQELELIEYLTGLENALLPYHLSAHLPLDAAVSARAEALLAKLGVAHAARRLPARLSQGERQRVAVARALVTEPDLLVADEPTGNLDPENADALLQLLFERAAEREAALLVVTHDHGLLERFDRVVDARSFAGGVA